MKETKQIHWEKFVGGYRLTKFASFKVGIIPKVCIILDKYCLSENGWLMCWPGTWWNGADIAIDSKTNMRASLVHDLLINMVQDGRLPNDWYTKWLIDSQYMRLAKEDGMFILRRWLHFVVIQWNQWQRKFRK